MDWVKDFDVWFGATFLVFGVMALLIGCGLGVYFIRRPPRQRSTLMFLLIPMGLGLGFSTLGGYFAGTGLAAQEMEQRLRTSGVSTRARVVQVERTGTRLNGRYLWRVRYEYRDPTGRAYEGASGYLERIDAESYRVGDQAFIRYDPQQPSESIWLGREDRAGLPGDDPPSG